MRKYVFISLVFGFSLLACKTKNESKIPVLKLAWESDTLFKTPESVLWDSKNKVIYVSNMNLNPRQKDGNGSIGKLNIEGRIIEAEWVTGLSSPKGMALIDNELWVADIDELVCINIHSGEISKKITIPGAGLLNDLTSDNMGALYISDTDSNAIYKLENGSITLISNQGISAPNGLLFDSGRLLLASMGSTDFAAVDLVTGVKTVIAPGINKGDGIAKINKNEYIVSDWFGELFHISPDSTKQSLIKTAELKIYAADIDYVAAKKLLLVPTFFNNKVMAYKLE